MKLSYSINFALLILFVGLLWFIQQPASTDSTSNTLSDLSSTSVMHISIQRQNTVIELEKNEQDWQIQSPFSARANNTRIALLLNLLNTTSQQRLNITDDTDLNQFGLTTPLVTVRLNNHVFEFGDKAPLQQKTYVKYKRTIYLVDDSISQLLNSSANAYIDNRLFSKDLTLRKLTLPQTTLSFKDGHWHSDGLSLTQDEILKVIEHWQYASALQVSPYKNDIATSSRPLIELWFNNHTEPQQFILHSNTTLIDVNSRLSYQFSTKIKQQLLLTEPKSVRSE
jgi:hypothetical protein